VPIPLDLAEALPSKQREIPPYIPPLGYIQYKAGEAVTEALDELSTFFMLLSDACLERIVSATNSYAQRDQDEQNYDASRRWIPITRAELLRFIGCLFYMGMHRETLRDDYWRPPSRLATVISKNRFDQLHRYIHIRDKYTHPQTEQEGFHWKVEPIATMIRTNCQQNWLPATHVAIDEAMLPFRGRSEDTVKMKNKPIKEGFKVWVLADLGYVYNWLWFGGHKNKGAEIIRKKNWKYPLDNEGTTASFAPTFAVIIHLAQLLAASSTRVFVLVLDNLFLNLEVA
jgi:hypothetical protein